MPHIRPLRPNENVVERPLQLARKNVTTACKGCREQRVKCSGGFPCSKCVEVGRECVYDAEDRRSRTSHKRKLEELEKEKHLLDDLLDTIKHSKDTEVAQIVSLIRSSAPPQELKACIASQLRDLRRLGREPSPELTQVRNDVLQIEEQCQPLSQNPSEKDRLQVSRLIDDPLVQVSAAAWTNVTNDDELVGNLLSNWLTWDLIWYNWLDPESLLNDMRDSHQETEYCSTFLVNSVLAWACPFSDFSEARSSHGSTSKLMTKFVDEARVLLESELAKGPKLTTVQGLMFLFFSTSLMGQDRVGYELMLLATRMADALASPITGSRETSSGQYTKHLEEAIRHTHWGVFNLVTASCLSFMRKQSMLPPTAARPQWKPESHIMEQWTPYPRVDQRVRSYVSELFDIECSVAVIASAFTQASNQDGQQETSKSHSFEDIDKLESKLASLLRSLPEHLRWKADSAPPILVHHLWFRAVHLKMCLYQWATSSSQPNEARSNGSMDAVTERMTKLAVEISQLSRQCMDSHGSKITCMATQPVSMALYVLLEHTTTISYHQAITDLCMLLRALARRWPMSMAVLRMVQHKAKQLGTKLPSATDKLFEDFELQDWTAQKILGLESIYPDPDSVSYKSPEVQDMRQFLERMEALGVKDQPSAEEASQNNSEANNSTENAAD